MLRFQTLGQVDLRDPEGRPVQELLTQPRRLALLAYLAVARPRGLHRRDRLVALFWPDLDDSRARAALSQALHVLRKALGAGVLVTRGSEEVGLDFGRVLADADQFQQAADAGALSDADRLYRGELLPGFHLSDAPEFEHWLDGARTRLRERAVAIARAGADQADTAADPAIAAAWLGRLLELEPLDETALQRLVTLRAEAGDRAGALRAYEEFAARIARELETSPSPKTEALIARVRAERPAARPSQAPASAPTPAPAHPGPPGSGFVEPPSSRPAEPESSGADGPVATPAARRRGRWLVAGLLVAAGLFLVLPWRASRAPAAPDRVAVLPFVIRGDTALAYLGEGLVDLLTVKLEALGAFATVDPAVALARVAALGIPPDSLADPVRAAALARDLEAGHFVLGRVVETGGRIELAATLYDAGGTRQAVVAASATDAGGLPEAVDRLARDLVATLWSTPAARLSRLAMSSTTDPVALRHYLEGERAYRSGQYAAARDAFLEATRADSLFALAHYRLSVAAGWLADERWYVGGAERALALADRLTSHDRALVEARVAAIRGPADEAEERYRAITRDYPDDAEAWYQLGEVLFHDNPYRGRAPSEAAESFRRSAALLGGSLDAQGHLVQLQLMEGDWAGAVPAMDSLIAGYGPEESRGHIYSVLRAVAAGDSGAALQRLATVPVSDLWVLGRSIATYTPALQVADSVAGLLRSPERAQGDRILGHLLRTELRMARGQWRGAREELAQLRLIDPSLSAQVDAYYVTLPWVPLGARDLVQARESLAAWSPSLSPPPSPPGVPQAADREVMQLFYEALLVARGGDSVAAAGVVRRLELALAAAPSGGAGAALPLVARAAYRLGHGNPVGALAALDSITEARGGVPTLPQVSHALVRFLRAEALAATGRHAEALGYYRSFVVLFGYDLPFRGPGLLGQAEELASQGRIAESRQRYRDFLALYGDSDPRFEPLLRRARLALAPAEGG